MKQVIATLVRFVGKSAKNSKQAQVATLQVVSREELSQVAGGAYVQSPKGTW